MTSARQRLENAVKSAMYARDKQRLAVLRLIMAAIKQFEVDERTTPDETQVIEILVRLRKQRREAIEQYRTANRHDLADQEAYEIDVLQEFMPQPLTGDKLEALIEMAIKDTGARTPRDMGMVMSKLKPEVRGRADMQQVSTMVKTRLSVR